MNNLQFLCSKCNKHTEMSIENNIIHFKCQCSFYSTMNMKDSKERDKSYNTITDDSIKNTITDVNKGNAHLLTYFKEINNAHLGLSISQNYKEYNILEQINIEEVKTITAQTDCIYSLLYLKDGRVASCSRDSTISIYSPSKEYHCDKVINKNRGSIPSICELDDGIIVSCSSDGSIMIGDYTIKNAHNGWINKVIVLSNNRIASCSDKTIMIWKSDTPYSNTPIVVLEGQSVGVSSLLYIKERDIMISKHRIEHFSCGICQHINVRLCSKEWDAMILIPYIK